MKTVSISGSPRVNVGKKDAQLMRRQGLIPCVIYGGKEQVHFSAPEAQFKNLVYTPEVHTVKLDVDGRQFDAFMKEIQFHRVTDKILHIDFLEIIPGKHVIMDIPVKFEGSPVGVKEGGKLLKKMRTVKIKGPIEKMPDHITLNVQPMNIGDTIKVSDLKYDGLTFLDTSNNTIVAVRITRNVVEEAAPAIATTAGAPVAGAAAPAAGAAAPAAGAPAAGAAAKKPEGKK